MFRLFKKDPVGKMKKEYAKLLEKGMQAQRNGNIELYAKLSKEADDLMKKIDEIEKPKNS